MADLFPETLAEKKVNARPEQMRLHSQQLDQWGHPVASIELITHWTADKGWTVGWLVQLEKCLDEWHPAAPNAWRVHASYPWYRPEEMPQSTTLAVASGTALRAAKLVMAQMLQWASPSTHEAAQLVSDSAEKLAQRLLVEGE